MLIDTHTHFYDEWLLPDAEAAVQRALEAGVGLMIQADVDSRERPAMWEIGNRHPGVIFEMLGLYPGSVADNWREELDQVHRIAARGYFDPYADSYADSYAKQPQPGPIQETTLDQVREGGGPGPIPFGGPGPAGVPLSDLGAIVGGPGPGGKSGPGPIPCGGPGPAGVPLSALGAMVGGPGPGGKSGPGPIPCGGPGPAGVPLSALGAIVGGPGPGGKSGPGPAAASQSQGQGLSPKLDSVPNQAPSQTQSPTPSPIVAIGEIGLDYHEGLEFVEQQKEVFRLQLELAARMDLPVNIHLRDAWEDLFAILADCRHLHLRGNLHCFTASYEVYERANRYGEFSVGIGGVVTFKNAGLAKTLERIPLERILLETDAPYLAPVPYRGRRNESAYLPLVAAKVAEVKGLSVQEIESITTHNAIRLFNLCPSSAGRQ